MCVYCAVLKILFFYTNIYYCLKNLFRRFLARLFEETVQEYKSDNGQLVLVKEQKKLQKYSTDIADFIRKETAKEIFQKVVNICRKEEDFQDGTVNTQLEPLYFGIMNGCAFIRGEVKELAEQYGVEVEE